MAGNIDAVLQTDCYSCCCLERTLHVEYTHEADSCLHALACVLCQGLQVEVEAVRK